MERTVSKVPADLNIALTNPARVAVFALCALVLATTRARAQEPAANWLEARAMIEQLADAGDYVAALALEDRLLELAAADPDSGPLRVAEAHLLLARIHRANQDHAAAEEAILAAIEIYAAELGRMSPALIDPFLALGDTYLEAEDFTAAISSYSEARAIGRRNFGLLNEDQLPIIDKLTAAAEGLRQTEDAWALQLDALVLVERNHGESSLEAIEARYKYAHWLREHGGYDEELRLYHRTERIIAQQYDNDSLMMVRMLRERAASFRSSSIGDVPGSGGLHDAVEILRNMPDPPTLLIAEVLVELGDWYVEFNRTGGAGDEYLEAWTLLGQVENGDELREQWFTEQHEVEMAELSIRGISSDPDDPEGYVDVHFTVTATGLTRDIEITDSKPPGLKDTAALSTVRRARFRPRITDGRLVPTRRAVRFGFRYPAPEESTDNGRQGDSGSPNVARP